MYGPGGIDFLGLHITETETPPTDVLLAIDETIKLTGGYVWCLPARDTDEIAANNAKDANLAFLLT